MIKIGLVGYGNLAKGIETTILANSDMELIGIFTRRDPEKVISKMGNVIYSVKDILKFKDKIDVLIMCGGSAKDLPIQTVEYVKYFNVVDSFDTHANISAHFKNVDDVATVSKKVGIISVGWDPGMFSLARIYSDSILPNGKTYTFWGKGISQGHSDAIRCIDGVIDARQYTIPKEEARERVRKGETPIFEARDKHLRECFVVAQKNADKKRIEKEIKEMPNYFSDYDTIVHFITIEELQKNHQEFPHGGTVIRTGITGTHHHLIEYKLDLESNPEFTSSILLSYARACKRMYNEGKSGCMTVLDIPPKYLSIKDDQQLIKEL